MSAKMMGHVWDLQLPRMEAQILLAMADHADHAGGHVFPSQALIAWKTGYSKRQVQRVQESLKQRKILIPEGSGYRGVLHYRLDFSHVPLKPPFSTDDKMTIDKMSIVNKPPINKPLRSTSDKMSIDTMSTVDKMSSVKMSTDDISDMTSDISDISHNNDARADPSEEPSVQKTPSSPAASSTQLRRFDEFWQAYPRKKGKGDALKVWMRLKPTDALLAEMLSAIEHQRQSQDWTKEQGTYIPYPATWLNGHRWEDEDMTPGPSSPSTPRYFPDGSLKGEI